MWNMFKVIQAEPATGFDRRESKSGQHGRPRTPDVGEVSPDPTQHGACTPPRDHSVHGGSVFREYFSPDCPSERRAAMEEGFRMGHSSSESDIMLGMQRLVVQGVGSPPAAALRTPAPDGLAPPMCMEDRRGLLGLGWHPAPAGLD